MNVNKNFARIAGLALGLALIPMTAPVFAATEDQESAFFEVVSENTPAALTEPPLASSVSESAVIKVELAQMETAAPVVKSPTPVKENKVTPTPVKENKVTPTPVNTAKKDPVVVPTPVFINEPTTAPNTVNVAPGLEVENVAVPAAPAIDVPAETDAVSTPAAYAQANTLAAPAATGFATTDLSGVIALIIAATVLAAGIAGVTLVIRKTA